MQAVQSTSWEPEPPSLYLVPWRPRTTATERVEDEGGVEFGTRAGLDAEMAKRPDFEAARKGERKRRPTRGRPAGFVASI